MFLLRMAAVLIGGAFFSTAAFGQGLHDTRIPKSALEALRKLDRIEGSAVGEDGSPGEFFELSNSFLAKGKSEDFLALTKEENPIVRAMGLVCLTRKDKRAARGMLMKKLTSRARYLCFSGGCVGENMTEGQFAWELLHDANYLLMGKEKPWLSNDELLGIDLTILSNDACYSYHYAVQYTIGKLFEGQPNLQAIEDFSKKIPGLSEQSVVKALGRSLQFSVTRDRLMSWALDARLSTGAQLAAASGLTQDMDPQISRFLEKNDVGLLRLKPELGKEFFFTRQMQRRRHSSSFDELRAARERHVNRDQEGRSQTDWEKLQRDAFIQARLNDAPFALHDLNSAFSAPYLDDDRELAKNFARCFVRATERLREVANCWDTDSDNILRAAAFLDESRDFLQKNLSLQELSTAKKNVEIARTKLQADCPAAP